MIKVHRSRGGLGYTQKWFARESSGSDPGRLVAYFQYLGEKPPRFFIRRAFSTILVGLGREPEAIQADMHKNVRYEIKRADGEGLVWETGVDPSSFAMFHDSFAKDKGIPGVGPAKLESFGDALLLTRALKDGRTLSQHAYVIDREEGRARFLYSSSGRFEGTDSALVGRANRWCHWKDMLYLRGIGIGTYDLGGIAEGAADPSLVGINDFKQRFGGRTVREDHWLSPLYALASLLGAKQDG